MRKLQADRYRDDIQTDSFTTLCICNDNNNNNNNKYAILQNINIKHMHILYAALFVYIFCNINFIEASSTIFEYNYEIVDNANETQTDQQRYVSAIRTAVMNFMPFYVLASATTVKGTNCKQRIQTSRKTSLEKLI